MDTEPKKLIPNPPAIYLIGAGGVASYLLPPLVKLLKRCENAPPITIIDGDKLEKRNLDRQMFHPDMIGMFKAEALSAMIGAYYPVSFQNEWFLEGMETKIGSLILSCVDNHPARRAILSTVDTRYGYAILGGNEELDCEAMYYDTRLKNTPYDPRVFYPTIMTNNDDDPIHREAGCTGEEILNQTPQLALANMGAAYYMLHMFWFFFTEAHKLDKESEKFLPVKHYNNFSRCGTVMRVTIDQNNGSKEQNEKRDKKEETVKV